MIDSLAGLGFALDVIVISRQPVIDSPWSQRHQFHAVQPPPLRRAAWSTLVSLLRSNRSLNECLYTDSQTTRTVIRLVARVGATAVIADSLRLAALAEATGLPYLVDLDDLLSERYAELARTSADTTALLGYYGDSLPRWLRRPAGSVARLALRREARICRARELEIGRRAPAVSLVSQDEASRLSELVDRPVASLPAAITVTMNTGQSAARSGIAFLGGLNYQANLDALRWYRDAVLPELQRLGKPPMLHVIGQCPDTVRNEFQSSSFTLEGYVDDLPSHLSRYSALVAPITSGTGVKTKVLDAMASAVPVIGTPAAFAGLSVRNGYEVYVGRDPSELADQIRHVLGSPSESIQVGQAGRDYVARNFSPDVVTQRWRSVLDALTRFDSPSGPPKGISK